MSGRGLEEAGACDEEEDNQLVILPTSGVLTTRRQQNIKFMAPCYLTSRGLRAAPWRSGGGIALPLWTDVDRQTELISDRCAAPPPACSAPCICIQSEQTVV